MEKTSQITERSQRSHVQQLLSSISKSHKRHLLLDRANNSVVHSERSFTLNTFNQINPQTDSLLSLLTRQVKDKVPWKGSSLKLQEDPVKRLSHKYEMDAWEISRIQLSKRSYEYPKSFKGIKIPQKGRQFSRITQKDKQGHLPYLYQNDIKKYESLKQKLSITPFKVTNSVRHDYFGLGKQKYLRKSRHSNLGQLLQANKRSYELSLL